MQLVMQSATQKRNKPWRLFSFSEGDSEGD
jgi:hypothetical protein